MNETVYIVDAFTDQPFSGNPAGVVFMNEERPDDWKLSIARELNLSETAFILRTNNQIKLRWFTPQVEVDLCGHATLASAHSLFSTGAASPRNPIQFITRSGALRCRFQDGWIWMEFPLLEYSVLPQKRAYETALRIAPEELYKTGDNVMAIYRTSEEVTNADPDLEKIRALDAQGVIITSASPEKDTDFISRYFAPKIGIDEDPVTGSSHCSLAPYWGRALGKKEMLAKQASSRGGVLKLKLREAYVEIGGQARTVISGKILV